MLSNTIRKRTQLRSKQSGVTLLESMLVLAIIAAIIIMGIRFARQFQTLEQIRIVQGNVTTLFNGLETYYKQNCNSLMNPGSPNASPSAVMSGVETYYPVLLTSLPAFAQPASGTHPKSSLITSTLVNSTDTNNYIVQFNLHGSDNHRIICQDPYNCGTGNPTVLGIAAIWTAQVAVELAGDAQKYPSTYQKLLGANCLSSSTKAANGGTVVFPCNNAKGSTYAVWEQLPSAGSNNNPPVLGITTPIVTQFNQMYNTDPVLNLTNPSYQNNLVPAYQYYNCAD